MVIIYPPIQKFVEKLINEANQNLFVISPWVKAGSMNLVVDKIRTTPTITQVEFYTRISSSDFTNGVSDIEALEQLLACETHSEIRCITNLHAKVYISDFKNMLITSGNLTNAGLNTNVEIGVQVTDAKEIQEFVDYFRHITSECPLLSKEVLGLLEHECLLANEKRASVVENNSGSFTYGKRVTFKKSSDKFAKSDIELPRISIASKVSKQPIFKDFKSLGILAILNKLLGAVKIEKELLEQCLIHTSVTNSQPEFSALTFERSALLGTYVTDVLVSLLLIKKHKIKIPQMIMLAQKHIRQEQILAEIFQNVFGTNNTYWLSENPTVKETYLNSRSLLSILGLVLISDGWSKVLALGDILFSAELDNMKEGGLMLLDNPKTAFQEISQGYLKEAPSYVIKSESGPDDKKVFVVSLLLKGVELSEGVGSSKSKACEDAASKALNLPRFNTQLKSMTAKRVDEYHRKFPPYTFNTGGYKGIETGLMRSQNLSHLLNRVGMSTDFIDELGLILTEPMWFNDRGLKPFGYTPTYKLVGSQVINLILLEHIYRDGRIPVGEIGTALSKMFPYSSVLYSELGIGDLYLTAHGTNEITSNMQSGVVESFVGFMFLNKEYDFTKDCLSKFSQIKPQPYREEVLIKDPTSTLQEYLQKDAVDLPEYEIEKIEGPEDNRTYYISVYYKDNKLGSGLGTSISRARSSASREALVKLGVGGSQ